MGHLLRSINPEASAAIQAPASAPPMPDVGEVVIYHMRVGHGRQGRTRFPALVQSSDGRKLGLTVIMEAGELKNETLVEEIGPGKDHGHVWERPDYSYIVEAFRNTVTSAHTRIGDLETQVERMGEVVLGEFDAPKVSIIHIMQDFENRLASLRRELDDAREQLAIGAPARGKGKRK